MLIGTGNPIGTDGLRPAASPGFGGRGRSSRRGLVAVARAGAGSGDGGALVAAQSSSAIGFFCRERRLERELGPGAANHVC